MKCLSVSLLIHPPPSVFLSFQSTPFPPGFFSAHDCINHSRPIHKAPLSIPCSHTNTMEAVWQVTVTWPELQQILTNGKSYLTPFPLDFYSFLSILHFRTTCQDTHSGFFLFLYFFLFFWISLNLNVISQLIHDVSLLEF